MALRRAACARLLAALLLAVPSAFPRAALAQPPPPSPGAKPGAKPVNPANQAPPGTKTDLELDPDAKPAPPPEPPPLPPAEPGQWGVGGKDEEGKFAPPSKKKEEEEGVKKAEEDEKKPVDLGPARTATIDMVVGFGSMRDVTNDTGLNDGKTRVTSYSFIYSFNWRVAESWNLGARFAFTNASITGPGETAKDDYNTYAAGNLELYVRPSFQLTRRLRLPAELAVYIPTAQGDLFGDITQNRVPLAQALVNQAGSYSRGWEEMPLFAARRIGLRAGAGITYDTENIHVAAGTHLDLMGKVSGNDDPSLSGSSCTTCKLSTPTTAWVTAASFFYGFGVAGGFIEPGLRAWLALATLPVYSPTRDYSGPQLVVEPTVSARFPVNADKSMAVRGTLGLILPVSGPLGGASAPFDASIHGFRVKVDFMF